VSEAALVILRLRYVREKDLMVVGVICAAPRMQQLFTAQA
jgi:hypothetical protein